MQHGSFYPVRLLIGERYQYTERTYSRAELLDALQRFFALNPDDRLSVRVSDLTFVAPGYVENGYEIVASNYPRYPLEPDVILARMRRLARYLLQEMNQERVSLETPIEVVVTEKADVQES